MKIIDFLKEVKIEVKKINWPTRNKAVKYTLIVISFSLVVAVFLGFFDFIFQFLIRNYLIP